MHRYKESINLSHFWWGFIWCLPTVPSHGAQRSEGWNYFDRLWPLWEWAVRVHGTGLFMHRGDPWSGLQDVTGKDATNVDGFWTWKKWVKTVQNLEAVGDIRFGGLRTAEIKQTLGSSGSTSQDWSQMGD